MSDAVCDVCQIAIKKYKCPACASSSCSLACFTKHKSDCAGESGISAPVKRDLCIAPDNVSKDRTANTIDRAKLEALFAKHHNLRTHLREIYLSTLEPDKNASYRNGADSQATSGFRTSVGSHRLGRNWKPEKGFETGVEKLRSIIETRTGDSEALEEFMYLIR